MKFWGLLAMVAHIAQQNHKDNTTNHNVPIQRESLSLILVDKGQAYNSKHKPQQLPNETLGFNWDGHAYSMHNITKIPDWLIFLNQAFSLVMMLMSIARSLHNLSQQDFIHAHTLPIYTCHTPHILWTNHQVYTIQYCVQQGRNSRIKCMPIF